MVCGGRLPYNFRKVAGRQTKIGRAEMAGGRPKKYKPEYVKTAQVMARVGCTEAEIAEALNVNRTTFWRWKAENPGFCNAVVVGREEANERVEKALYSRAVGFTRKAEKVVSYQGVSEIIELREEVPPDVAAGKFWLTNQKRKEWQNMPEFDPDSNTPVMNIQIGIVDANRDPDDDL